jgi:hypothetical protein
MKKTIIFMAILGGLFTSCSKQNKYLIKDSNGNYYRTNLYETLEEGCIEFKDDCSCGSNGEGIDTKICGSYTIIENKIEK